MSTFIAVDDAGSQFVIVGVAVPPEPPEAPLRHAVILVDPTHAVMLQRRLASWIAVHVDIDAGGDIS